jgi:hypothetical protein
MLLERMGILLERIAMLLERIAMLLERIASGGLDAPDGPGALARTVTDSCSPGLSSPS